MFFFSVYFLVNLLLCCGCCGIFQQNTLTRCVNTSQNIPCAHKASLTCKSRANVSRTATLCLRLSTSSFTGLPSMDISLWEQVFTSLKSTVMRLVLALYLFSKASYWLGARADGDSAAADVVTGKLWALGWKNGSQFKQGCSYLDHYTLLPRTSHWTPDWNRI